MSATFQCTSRNFKQLYLLGLLAKLAALGLVGKLVKSAFQGLLVQVNWISRLGDMRQNVQHVQSVADSAASRKSPPLIYLSITYPRTLYMPWKLTY